MQRSWRVLLAGLLSGAFCYLLCFVLFCWCFCTQDHLFKIVAVGAIGYKLSWDSVDPALIPLRG